MEGWCLPCSDSASVYQIRSLHSEPLLRAVLPYELGVLSPVTGELGSGQACISCDLQSLVSSWVIDPIRRSSACISAVIET